MLVLSLFSRIAHLTDYQREVIILFKREQQTRGLEKCRQILPDFFSNISKHQLDRVYRNMRTDDSPVARRRKKRLRIESQSINNTSKRSCGEFGRYTF